MRTILVISDSHGALAPIHNLLAFMGKTIDAVLHLGDHSADIVPFARQYPDIVFHSVSGNCDFSGDAPECLTLTVCNRRLFLLHGHTHGVKSGYARLSYAAEEKRADVCLFGHTHMPDIFQLNGIQYMNPGSIALPRAAALPTYGVLEISAKGTVACRLIEISPAGYRPL